MRRLAARNEVTPATDAVSYDEGLQNKKIEEENASHKLMCYKKFKDKCMMKCY